MSRFIALKGHYNCWPQMKPVAQGILSSLLGLIITFKNVDDVVLTSSDMFDAVAGDDEAAAGGKECSG